MNSWLRSIRHCLGSLTRFSSRDRPVLFWPYAGTVIAAVFIVWGIAMASVMARLQRTFMEHSESVTVASDTGEYSGQFNGNPPPEFTNFFSDLLHIMYLIVVVVVALMAAAITRRLHDRNRAGWWGLLPVPFLAFGLVAMDYFHSRMMENGEPPMIFFSIIFVNNIIYIACLITLIVMLASSSQPVDNRYGPALSPER